MNNTKQNIAIAVISDNNEQPTTENFAELFDKMNQSNAPRINMARREKIYDDFTNWLTNTLDVANEMVNRTADWKQAHNNLVIGQVNQTGKLMVEETIKSNDTVATRIGVVEALFCTVTPLLIVILENNDNKECKRVLNELSKVRLSLEYYAVIDDNVGMD